MIYNEYICSHTHIYIYIYICEHIYLLYYRGGSHVSDIFSVSVGFSLAIIFALICVLIELFIDLVKINEFECESLV